MSNKLIVKKLEPLVLVVWWFDDINDTILFVWVLKANDLI